MNGFILGLVDNKEYGRFSRLMLGQKYPNPSSGRGTYIYIYTHTYMYGFSLSSDFKIQKVRVMSVKKTNNHTC